MGLKDLIAATAAIGLMATPTLVSAQTAPTPAPTYETVSGMQQSDDGFGGVFVWVGVAVALGLLAWVVLDDDDEDAPASP